MPEWKAMLTFVIMSWSNTNHTSYFCIPYDIADNTSIRRVEDTKEVIRSSQLKDNAKRLKVK